MKQEQSRDQYRPDADFKTVPRRLLELAQSDRLKEIKYKMQSLYMKLYTQEAAENVIRERVFPLLEGGPK